MLILLQLFWRFLILVFSFLVVASLGCCFTARQSTYRMRLTLARRLLISPSPRVQILRSRRVASSFASRTAPCTGSSRYLLPDQRCFTARYASTGQKEKGRGVANHFSDSEEEEEEDDDDDDDEDNYDDDDDDTDSDEEIVDMIDPDAEDAGSDDMEFSDYENWVRRLYTTNMFHPVKMGLKNIEELHLLLERPLDKTTVVHIAGTNGKGSVALKIARTLEKSNPDLKVGLFCSPHVSSFRERMQVNGGELISEEEVSLLLPPLYDLCKRYDIPATFFELTTALACCFFSLHEVDVVVLETGLGGRLDATNVVKSPALSVITSIGLEHTRILGDTIEKIALEKGGIIKEGCPVLVGPHVPHDVLRQCASEKGASGYYTCDDVLGPDTAAELEDEDYDRENARIATAAIKLLQKSHPEVVGGSIPDEIIREGTSLRPPCRFELRKLGGLDVILDVAHNPPAMDYLVRKLKKTYPDAKFRIVVGMSADKNLSLCTGSILKAVDGDASRIHLVEASHARAAKLEAILESRPEQELKGIKYDPDNRSVMFQIHSAMQAAVLSKDHEVLVVCGSVFIMGEAREALGYDEPRDSPYIAQVAGAGVRNSQENFGNSSRPDADGPDNK